MKSPPYWLTVLSWMEPRIADLCQSDRNELIDALKDSKFDGIETAGIIAGLVGVTYITQRPAASDWFGAMTIIAWQFGVALVLMAGIVGLMHLRRAHRVTRDYFRLRRRHE